MQPATGRFWSMDSFEGNSSDPSSLHKYTYASNDAVNRSDPSGHLGVTTAELHATLSINTILASNSAMILGTAQTSALVATESVGALAVAESAVIIGLSGELAATAAVFLGFAAGVISTSVTGGSD